MTAVDDVGLSEDQVMRIADRVAIILAARMQTTFAHDLSIVRHEFNFVDPVESLTDGERPRDQS